MDLPAPILENALTGIRSAPFLSRPAKDDFGDAPTYAKHDIVLALRATAENVRALQAEFLGEPDPEQRLVPGWWNAFVIDTETPTGEPDYSGGTFLLGDAEFAAGFTAIDVDREGNGVHGRPVRTVRAIRRDGMFWLEDSPIPVRVLDFLSDYDRVTAGGAYLCSAAMPLDAQVMHVRHKGGCPGHLREIDALARDALEGGGDLGFIDLGEPGSLQAALAMPLEELREYMGEAIEEMVEAGLQRVTEREEALSPHGRAAAEMVEIFGEVLHGVRIVPGDPPDGELFWHPRLRGAPEHLLRDVLTMMECTDAPEFLDVASVFELEAGVADRVLAALGPAVQDSFEIPDPPAWTPLWARERIMRVSTTRGLAYFGRSGHYAVVVCIDLREPEGEVSVESLQ